MNDAQETEKVRVLIVDDDPVIRRVLTTGLQRAGYDTEEAESGEQALDLIGIKPPDIALLDISMQGMSGMELARRLHDETSIPFMFITSFGESELVTDAIQHGAVGYLVKPIDINTIVPAIRIGLARAGEIGQLRRREKSLNASLSQIQEQLVQTDKMASIGQLAAGVAHEINNPIGYVSSNIGSLEGYINELFEIVDAYAAIEAMPENSPERRKAWDELTSKHELQFLREDIPALLGESKEGIKRVRQIVQDLKDFSHVDNTDEWQWANLHKGLDSTLNVINNEIKYRADVVKEYGDVPEVECLPGPLNQVFMNLLINAVHAIGEGRRGKIVVRTGTLDDQVWIEISDDGCGISPDNLTRIFNPFFTTKPIGKGTGLGLSLSHGIIQKHGGTIKVESTVGAGTCFRIAIPARHTAD